MRQPVSSRHSRCSANRALAGIDAAAGQLELVVRPGLLGDEHVTAVADHRVDAGALAVAARGIDPVVVAAHGGSFAGPPEPSRFAHRRASAYLTGHCSGRPAMTLAGRIAWDDTVLPFQLDRADIRGRVGRLDSVLETILGQHDYPAPVAALVAEATLITALIGQTIKLGGSSACRSAAAGRSG